MNISFTFTTAWCQKTGLLHLGVWTQVGSGNTGPPRLPLPCAQVTVSPSSRTYESLHTNSPSHPQTWPKPNTPIRPWQCTMPSWGISHANPIQYFGNENKTHDALLPVISPLPDEARPWSIPSDSSILILLRTHWQGCLCWSICDLSNLLKWGLLYTQKMDWMVAPKDVSPPRTCDQDYIWGKCLRRCG